MTAHVASWRCISMIIKGEHEKPWGSHLLKERQADGIAAKKARGEKTGRPCADIKKVQEIDELRSRGVRLRIACDHAGLGVSTYYKLRNQMKNQ